MRRRWRDHRVLCGASADRDLKTIYSTRGGLCMQVDVSCTARVPSSSGRPGQGQTYFSSQPGQPLHWVVGSSKVSPCL